MDERRSLYDILMDDLKYCDENSLRARKYTGYHSQDYDNYMHMTLNGKVIQDKGKIAGIAMTVIKDAFDCGYDISDYVSQFKNFCEENKL